MSTRCNILLTRDTRDCGEAPENDPEIWLYHHSDGYPAHVGRELCDLMEWICENRHQYVDIETISTTLVKGCLKPHLYGDCRTAPVDDGYEITTCEHCDIEYLYTITEHWIPEGTGIDVVEVDCKDVYSGKACTLCRVHTVKQGFVPDYEYEQCCDPDEVRAMLR